jgi:NosR/NirI family transcriptional regulator, nitrous oxide reductase regulator
MIKKIQSWLINIFQTASGESHRPILSEKLESTIPGLFVVGDLAGAPVIKLAMEQGYNTVERLSSLKKSTDKDILDIIIIGAGAAGLNAALAAKDKGFSTIVLEKEKIANTIENFPEGKWVYAEPDEKPAKGKLWLDGAQKEDLINRWHQIVNENQLDIRVEEAVVSVKKENEIFSVQTEKGSYKSQRIILATGQRGNPRKLGVPGEEQEHVYHRLYSPRKYQDEQIVVIGGGNSAVEAAITLSDKNKVILSYRKSEFERVFKDNIKKLNEAIAKGKVEIIFNSNIKEFKKDTVLIEKEENGRNKQIEIKYNHTFVLIGAELPIKFLKSIGIKLENDWEGSLLRSAILGFSTLVGLWLTGGQTGFLSGGFQSMVAWIGVFLSIFSIGALINFGRKGDRWAWLSLSFLIWYSIYGIKVGEGREFWPFTNWGYEALNFAGRPWSFWYTVIYTSLMTIFGIQALKRWGLDKKDRFQVWRYISLIGFQWLFFFLIPEFLFQWAVKYQWIGELAKDPVFADQAWRSYGIVYAWPLFFYTFFYNPHTIWIIWGVTLTFVIIPVLVLFHGKRYCSWICGCGGLAETFGDRWRHLAPKGRASIKWETMGTAVLVIAFFITVMMLIKDAWGIFSGAADTSVHWYGLMMDVWLVGILPVTLYPFLGGKVWCRYWCPLAKLMQIISKFYAKIGISKFHIHANDKCIGCYECSRNCQVGIDVMSYALKQEVLDNETSSCIGCGICVTVCPMDTLSFNKPLVQISNIEN